MNSSNHSIRRRGLVYLFSGVFALGGIFAALQGAQATKGTIELKRDDQPVNRGQLEAASFANVVKKVSPSVVTINVEGTVTRNVMQGMDDPFLRQFFGGRIPQMQQIPERGLGSGVIISADGYIVTNNHVVENADKLTVTLNDGRVFKDAKVIGRDPETEVAVVKINARDLPSVTLADSSKVEVGDRVLAIGNPFGIGETVTSGIVSATGRRVGIIDGEGYEDFIQTDASINPGNSGGALIDVQGRLIGLNTAIIGSGASNGVGLAVPVNIVSYVANSIVQNGKVVRGYLGVEAQSITPDLMDALKLKTRSGALVTNVVEDSPAEKAGFKENDVITAVNGRAVTDSSMLHVMVSQIAPGTPLEVDVLRDGNATHLKATTGSKDAEVASVGNGNGGGIVRNFRRNGGNSRQNYAPAPKDDGVLNGVAVDDLDRNARQQFNIPSNVKGAIVSQVDPSSASAKAGINPGDVILSINQKPVTSAEEAVKLSENAPSKKTLVQLWSKGGKIYTVVDESETNSRE